MQTPFRSSLARLVLCLSLSPMAQAASLGLDSSLNLLVFGNFSATSSDVEGRVVVGGNASLSNYSVNTKNGSTALHEGVGLSVNGNLRFGGGFVGADTWVGGNLDTSTGASFQGQVKVGGQLDAGNAWLSAGSLSVAGNSTRLAAWQNPRPQPMTADTLFFQALNVDAERDRLAELSRSLNALQNVGNVRATGGGIELDALGSSLAVFDLDASMASMNLSLLNARQGATIVINWLGSTFDFGNHGYLGFERGQVLFNLPDAQHVRFNGGVDASFLAPVALMEAGWGQINGQVVAGAWTGSVQVNDAPFKGSFPEAQQKVPEPAALALTILALAVAGTAPRQRAKSV